MDHKPANAGLPIQKNYWRNLFFISVLVFAVGLALSATVLLFQINHPGGASYGESFSLLANLRRDLLHKALIIYTFALVCISIGIIVLALLYSHRVVGPVYRLTMVARKLAEGDFSQKASLRKKDVLWALAGDMNGFITRYRETIRDLKKTVGEMTSASPLADQETAPPDVAAQLKKIAASTEEIDALLAKLKI